MSLRELAQFYDTNGHVGTLFADVDDESNQVISTHLQIDSPNGDMGPISVSMQVSAENIQALEAGFIQPERSVGRRKAKVPTVDLAESKATSLERSAKQQAEDDQATLLRARDAIDRALAKA